MDETSWLKASRRHHTLFVSALVDTPSGRLLETVDVHRGHATLVVDQVHAAQLANRTVDDVRRRVQRATLGHCGRKRDPLYRVRRRLLTASDDLTDAG